MEWMIHASSCILLTTVTGSIVLLSWYFVGRQLERLGFLDILYRVLKVVLLFFILPFVYLILCLMNDKYQFGNGVLFASSPVIVSVSSLFLRIWIVGTCLMSLWYLIRNLYAAFYYRKTFRCSKEKQQIFEQLCQEIGICPGKIRLCECYEAGSPFLMGVIKPRLFLPVDSFDETELKVILVHELTHYKQNDVLWKHIMLVILNLQWFNPFVWWLRWILREWSEFACDFSACDRVGGIKPYFSVIQRVAERTSSRIRGTSSQLVKKHELERRILYVSRCKAVSCQSKSRVGVIMLTLLFSSTVGVYSVSAAMAVGYITVFNETTVRTEYPRLSAIEVLSEHIASESKALDASEIVVGFTNYNRESSGTFQWELDGRMVIESQERYLEAGTNVDLHIFVDSVGKMVRVGIVTPSGRYRYTAGNNNFYHNFKISQSGWYKYFVQNLEEEPIIAEVYYDVKRNVQ